MKRSRASFSQIAVRLSRINSTLPLGELFKVHEHRKFRARYFATITAREREILRRALKRHFPAASGVPDLNALDYRKMAECGEKRRRGHEEEVKNSGGGGRGALPLARLNSSWTTRARRSKNEEERQQTKRYTRLGERSGRIVGGREGEMRRE